jgi:NAD(P)H-nitrite reductase large subunit
MATNRTYTTEQIAVVGRELREAAGALEERFTADEALDFLDGDIQALRHRGFTDQRITDLLTGFDLELNKNQVERRSKSPGNLLRRVILNRINGTQWQFDEPPIALHGTRP